MSNKFVGTGVALVTPFKNNEVDYDAISGIVEYAIQGGVDYLVALGSTGESATLNEVEQRQILDKIIAANAGRLPLVAGNFGGNNTKALCEKIAGYDFTKVDAILSSSPAYVKPSQKGILAHYKAIEAVSPIPVILYNVPGRTKSNIEWQTTVALAEYSDKIIGIKEATGDLIQATRIIKNKPENFFVTSGDDEVAMPMIAAGGQGVISVLANACPTLFSKMIKAALDEDFVTSRMLNFITYDLHHWLYVEGNPVGVKAAMNILGHCTEEVRLPLHPLSRENYNSLKKELAKVQEAFNKMIPIVFDNAALDRRKSN